MENYLIAGLLGLIEGLTEFLPVSSTGHLILFENFLGFQAPPGHTFKIMIQLGAILALITIYFRKISSTVFGLPSDPRARHFALLIVIAFLPAAILGAGLGSKIEQLLDMQWVVAVALIIGGVIMLIVEQTQTKVVHRESDALPYKTGFLIGVAQAVAMIPGVSRSGATIIGGLLLGLERRAAAEFSFYLSIPTMSGAFAYSAFKHRNELSFDDAGLIAVGFMAAFIAALLVVKPFLAVVGKIGFAPFAFYRIALGTFVLVLLYL